MKFTRLNTIRTNNFQDPEIQTKIMELWKESEKSIQDAGTQGKVIACVYHEYESNYTGDYSVSIAIEDKLKGEFDTAVFEWKVYPVDPSDDLGIVNTWKKIWAQEEQQLINRVYAFDFESYTNGEIAINVAVKK